MLASKNLQKPIMNASEGFHWIRVLSAELALRLNEARKASPHLWPKSIVLGARQGKNHFVETRTFRMISFVHRSWSWSFKASFVPLHK